MAQESTAVGAERVGALFLEEFDVAPVVVASAAARVNLIGEHTDYNGGEVLPIAIARRTWVAAGSRDGEARPVLRAVSATHHSMGSSALESPTRSGEWWDYLTGVAAPLLAATGRLDSIDLAVASDVPSGAGLSSSAALEVSGALAVSGVLDQRIELQEAAMTAWRAETGFVGVACGIMDQFAWAPCREGAAL